MRTFILCVGAQKSGTTWLFKQLIKSEKFCRGFSKEYHLFDALYLDNLEGAINTISRRIKNYPFQEGEDFTEKHERIMRSFYADEKNYYDYFDSILTTDGSFTSDITPSYSSLSSGVLLNIKKEFNHRNINLKVVFLMREPVTRLESSIRMGLRRKKSLHQTDRSKMVEHIHSAINSRYDKMRSDYIYTCQQIDKVFPSDEVFYGFYESLFTQSEINRLSLFLNMKTGYFDAQHVINATAKPFKYSLEEMNDFKKSVHDRYQFVLDRFNFDLSKWDEATLELVDTSL